MTLRMENVGFEIGKKKLINNVSLTVNPGEFAVIIGPNGAGKSTALGVLSGDLLPSSGAVYLGKTPYNLLTFQEQATIRGVLPQLSHASFAFTALDIILMGRIPHGETPECKNALRIAREVMEQTDTVALMGQDISTLSGGERQRVNLARVLAQVWSDQATLSAPKYLLLDEPISALDPKHQVNILSLLKSYAKRGYGIVAVLHDMAMASMFADKIHIMQHGMVAYSGEPAKVMTSSILSDIWQLEYNVHRFGNSIMPIVACG
jgi:iron complex transport system ATP-binding protein